MTDRHFRSALSQHRSTDSVADGGKWRLGGFGASRVCRSNVRKVDRPGPGTGCEGGEMER